MELPGKGQGQSSKEGRRPGHSFIEGKSTHPEMYINLEMKHRFETNVLCSSKGLMQKQASLSDGF